MGIVSSCVIGPVLKELQKKTDSYLDRKSIKSLKKL